MVRQALTPEGRKSREAPRCFGHEYRHEYRGMSIGMSTGTNASGSTANCGAPLYRGVFGLCARPLHKLSMVCRLPETDVQEHDMNLETSPARQAAFSQCLYRLALVLRC